MIWMNQVKQMYSVGSLPDDMRWLVILGDDVYINTARLYYFLAGHASRDDHPVIFAHASRRQSLAARRVNPEKVKVFSEKVKLLLTYELFNLRRGMTI